MRKYIKLKKLCLAVIADNVGTPERQIWEMRKNLVPVYPKYYFWRAEDIKYFTHAIDKIRYPATNTYSSAIKVIRYCSFSSICRENKKQSRIPIDKIYEVVNSSLAKEFVEETEKLYNSKQQNDLKGTDKASNMQRQNNINNPLYKYDIGRNLTDQKIYNEPAIGRDSLVDAVIETLIQPEGNPILVGNKGVGKTAIVKEVAYRIKNGNVPKALQGKNIIEVSSNGFISGTQYRGEFEEKVYSVARKIKDMNGILFIDDISNAVGAGETRESNVDLASMLKEICEHENIKIIGITNTNEYDLKFSNSKFSSTFEAINVREPDDFLLHQIISHIFERYALSTGVSIENLDSRIIDILVELTNYKNQVYFDRLANPKFVSGIINKAFGLAQIEESEYLTCNHLIMSIERNTRLYPAAKDTYIKRIQELDTMTEKREKSRVLRLY